MLLIMREYMFKSKTQKLISGGLMNLDQSFGT